MLLFVDKYKCRYMHVFIRIYWEHNKTQQQLLKLRNTTSIHNMHINYPLKNAISWKIILFSLTFILYPTIFFSQSVYIFMCLVYFFFQTPSKFTFSILLSNKNFTLIQIYPYMYDYIGKGRYIDTLFKVTFSFFFF